MGKHDVGRLHRRKQKSREYNRYLADGIIRNLAASKSKDTSAHSIGLVGEASVWSILLLGNDFDNKGFDRVLNGPTSAQWLDPWVNHLRAKGVTFHVGQALSRLTPNGRHIGSATVVDANGVPQPVVADWYVAAIPCEKLAAVLTPDVIAADPRLANVALLRTEWMNGLMFYLKERVDVTKGHVNYVDSGWAITSISEEQFWKTSLQSYGDGMLQSEIIADRKSLTVMVKIVELFQAPWWAPFKAADRARYRARLPHALDIVDTRWPAR